MSSSEEIELVNIEEIKTLQEKLDIQLDRNKKQARELEAVIDQKVFVL